MGQYIGPIIGIIAAIIGVILLVKLVIFLFVNFVASRILSIGTAIAALVLGIIIFPTMETEEIIGSHLLATIVLTALSWMFFTGDFVFAKFESDEIESIDWENLEVNFKTVGGFFLNLFVSLLVCGFIYGYGGSEFPAVFIWIPILLLVANAISIIWYVKTR